MLKDNGLNICPSCGGRLSEIDKHCPFCGVEVSRKSNALIIAFVIVGVLILTTVAAIGFLFYSAFKYENYNWMHTNNMTQTSTERRVESGSSVDFSGYMNNMQKNIKKNWNPPKLKKSAQVVVQYKIGKDGNLISYSVIKSSGIKKVDGAAIRALKKTAPFEPLPAGFKKPYVDVQFTFDYNIIGGKGKNGHKKFN